MMCRVPYGLERSLRRRGRRWGLCCPTLVRVVVAIDPAASSGEDADETGIIVAGKDKEGRGYVLADRSIRYSWTRNALLSEIRRD
jgi:phage terminase large subunit-like protein